MQLWVVDEESDCTFLYNYIKKVTLESLKISKV